MKPIIYHRKAANEVRTAVAQLNETRDGFGAEFRAALELATGRISQLPKLHSIYKETVYRKCVLSRFPYTLFYGETDEYIIIMAVAHHRRKPDYWLDREME